MTQNFRIFRTKQYQGVIVRVWPIVTRTSFSGLFQIWGLKDNVTDWALVWRAQAWSVLFHLLGSTMNQPQIWNVTHFIMSLDCSELWSLVYLAYWRHGSNGPDFDFGFCFTSFAALTVSCQWATWNGLRLKIVNANCWLNKPGHSWVLFVRNCTYDCYF